MKICIVGSVFPRHDKDHTEVPWHRETVRRCRDAGFEMMVYVPSFRGLASHVIDGVPVKRFRYFFAPWETLTGEEGAPNKIDKLHYKIITLFYLFFGTIGLIRLHLRERFDILHVHWPFPHGIFAFPAKLFRNTKIILNFHGAELLLARKHPYVRTFLRYFLEHADAVVCNSGFTRKRILDIHQRDVTVVPYGTTLAEQPSVRPTSEEHIILAAGRQIERKGYEYLIQALPSIIEKVPTARVVFTSGGNREAGLRQLTAELKMGDHVTFAGKVSNEELSRLYAQCDLFVLPAIVDSRGDTEGLGVVLIEAFSYKKPVVASDVGGIPDLVIHEKTGLLVPQKDTTALAHAICRVIHDKALAARLGQAGFEHAQRSYNWTVVVDRLSALYTTVAGKR